MKKANFQLSTSIKTPEDLSVVMSKGFNCHELTKAWQLLNDTNCSSSTTGVLSRNARVPAEPILLSSAPYQKLVNVDLRIAVETFK